MEGKHQHRIFLSLYFFLSGVCFSTWTSRIPTIKATFGYNDAELGTVLLFMPISSMIGLPLSGWLVSKFDTRQPMTVALILLCFSMTLIGWAPNTISLIAAVSLFSFAMRIMNIAINTQSLTIQRMFEKKITGGLHGLWSTGGIVGIGISTIFVALDVGMGIHLTIMALLIIGVAIYSYSHLLSNDRSTQDNKFKGLKPDPYIVYLGLMIFFALLCEGGMFDWSGVYFKEVVNEKIFTVGYLIFMICMATSRFASDWLMENFGMPKTYLMSSSLVITGIVLSVAFPYFWTAMLGFCLVGLGTAPVIPMTYLLAGSSKKYSAGVTVSIIATYGIVGMLIGPPLIGYISNALGLRLAFITFALSGFMIIPISQLFFSYKKKIEN